MSVGDLKGARRRMKALMRKGELPRPRGYTVHQSIERERAKAARQAAASGKKKG